MRIQEIVQPKAQAIQEAIQWHLTTKTPLVENVFRRYSDNWFQFFVEMRQHVANGEIFLENNMDTDIIASDLGTFAEYEGQMVPLDCPMLEPLEEAEYKGKEVELNKPKRGGSKKYYVYVKNPATGNVKKISFGDVSGLSVKIRDPKRRKAFAARHGCSGAGAKDRMSAKYWSCRLPSHTASLGLSPIHARWW